MGLNNVICEEHNTVPSHRHRLIAHPPFLLSVVTHLSVVHLPLKSWN